MEYRAAARRWYPMNSPAVIVPPERDTPGMSASACAKPKTMPLPQVSSRRRRVFAPTPSAMPSRMPKTMSVTATIQSERKVVSIAFWNARPRTTIGTLPRMTSQPIRASGSLRGTLPDSDWTQRETIRAMSRQKYSSTAASVPSWMIAVKRAPGSPPVPSSSPTMRMCALEEMGRNSVSPWTRPRMRALRKSMRPFSSCAAGRAGRFSRTLAPRGAHVRRHRRTVRGSRAPWGVAAARSRTR